MRHPSNPTHRVLLAAAVLSVFTLTSRADYATTVQSLNPAGYWRLSESVSPPAANVTVNLGSLGATADGFPYPGTFVTQGAPGVVGTAFAFTNTSAGANAWTAGSVVDVPYNAVLNQNPPFTVEFWAYPTPNGTTANDILVCLSSMNTAQSRSGWLIYHNTGGGTLGFDNNWEFRIGGLSSYFITIDTPSGSGPSGVWTHVVAVYDGALAKVYVNGVLAGSSAGSPGGVYNPNKTKPFRIGSWDGAGFGRNFIGSLDEVVYYNTALSASQVAAHFAAKTTNNAGYSTQILADNPVGYWPMNEPVYTPPAQSTLPVTANSGTLGTAARGTNQPGLTAGVPGPVGLGLPANLGASGRYAAGNVNLGNPVGLNFSNTITMMAWVKLGYASDTRCILSHGYRDAPSQEMQLGILSGNYRFGSLNNSDGTASTGGLATKDIGNWVLLTGTFDGSDWRLYRYGQLIAGPTPTAGIGVEEMDASWSIGSRGDTSTDGRFLGGGMDEVAIFTNALSQAQINSILLAAQMLPVIIVSPQLPAGTIFVADNLNFTVEAAGNPTLLYQWTKNSTNLPGATTTALALSSVTTNDTGTYAIVVTNDFGSITSSFPVTVVASPPLITQQPQNVSRYVGGSAPFSVGAVGPAPITYQWYYNTNTLIGGATSSNYTKSGLMLGDAGKYNCRITNPSGNTNSDHVTLTVVPAPTAPYPVSVLADNPVGYWRLGESGGSVAFDNLGGHNGSYYGVTLGQQGYSPFDPDTAASFGGAESFVGNITGIDFAGTGKTFTLEAWVKSAGAQVEGATIIGKGRGGDGGGGVNGLQFSLEVAGGKYRFRVQPTGSAADATFATAAVGPNGFYQHVVGVYDQGGGYMKIYVNGFLSGSGTPPNTGPLATTIPISIGAGRFGVAPNYDLYFNGSIDEAAIYNTALSETQVNNHYCGQFGAGQRPLILVQPTPVTQWEGWPITLSATVAGSCELTYQWKKGGTPLSDFGTISGASSQQLRISTVSLTDAGNYSVTAQNSSGTSNSAVVAVAVLPTPTQAIPIADLVMHLPFDNNLTDVTGRGNNGTGQRTTPSGTTSVAPGPGNGGAFEYVSGKLGNGLHFSTDAGPFLSGATVGTNDYYVTLGVRPDLKFGSSANFSVSYWMRMPEPGFPVNNWDHGDLPFFCDATNSTGGNGFTFAPSFGTNASSTAPTGGGGTSGSWAWSLNGTRTEGEEYLLNDQVWHHLVHTFDRQGNGVTYVDGVLVNSFSVVGAGNLDNNAPANIGQDPTGRYPETGQAEIDDLGVWRRALTEVEARGIYVAATNLPNGFSFVDITPSINPGPGVNQVTVKWQAGTLQSSTNNPAGPYANVPGATSPYTITPTVPIFYRTAY